MTVRKTKEQDPRVTNILEHIKPEFVTAGAQRMTVRDVASIVDASDEILAKFDGGATLERFKSEGRVLVSLLSDFQTGAYRDAPFWIIAVAAFTLCYVLKPIDIIPDTLPVIGQLDDAVVVALGLDLVREELDAYRVWKAADDTAGSP